MREYLLVFLTAAVVASLACVFARELAVRLGAVARVRARDVHKTPTPYFGGLAMLVGILAGLILAHRLPFLSSSNPQVFEDARVVFTGGLIICIVGVLDDLIELDALTKLAGQVVAAGYLVLNGVQLYSIRLPGLGQLALDPTQAMLISMLLIVGTVNAINFVDGLDGLAAGMVGIGALAFFVFSYSLAAANGETRAMTAAILCAALAGACAGFLPHNFNPARMFMGDSGSMLLGLMLSGATLTLTGQFAGIELDPSGSSGAGNWLVYLLPFLLPVSVLVIPFADLILAVVRRTRRGQAFYHPDKEHLHHRLLEIGHSHRKAVVIMWAWSAFFAFGVVALSLYATPLIAAVVLSGVLAVVVGYLIGLRLRSRGRSELDLVA